MADVFTSELAFEDALVEVLEKDYGWRNGILNHPSEQDLLDNWASAWEAAVKERGILW